MKNVILVCVLGLLSGSCADIGDTSQQAPLETRVPRTDNLATFLPGLIITPVDGMDEIAGAYPLTHFRYKSSSADWPYGSGFAVLDSIRDSVLWIHLRDGDYAPHTFRWADFDGDGKQDLLFHAGFEEVSETYVYVNRVVSESFAITNFAQKFQSVDTYASVLDLDGDGNPELLVPQPQPYGEQDSCFGPGRSDSAIVSEIEKEYRRLAGRFDGFNLGYRRGALFIEDTIRIGRLHGKEYWVEDQFPDHLKWRLVMLGRMRALDSPSCAEQYSRVSAYLEQLLKDRPH